jgi:prepilin-type N-terminal cleavage/methylation domain-containing protein
MTRDRAATPVPESNESGFTLVELMMVAALLGIVAVAVTSALIVGMKTFAGTDNKVVSSTDAQFVSVYLPADLQSVGNAPGSVTADPGHTASSAGGNFAISAIGDCAPPNAGSDTNVLRLAWSEDGGASYVAVYRVVSRDGEWQMYRFLCTNGTLVREHRVARNLNGNSIDDERVDVSDPRQVTLRLRSKARAPGDPQNFIYEITGTRRTTS